LCLRSFSHVGFSFGWLSSGLTIQSQIKESVKLISGSATSEEMRSEFDIDVTQSSCPDTLVVEETLPESSIMSSLGKLLLAPFATKELVDYGLQSDQTEHDHREHAVKNTLGIISMPRA
jgi:hypothetical protein